MIPNIDSRNLKPTTKLWLEAVFSELGEPTAVQQEVLFLAAEARDAYLDARQVIADDGRFYRDRFDQPKLHPMATVERQCRQDFLSYMRQFLAGVGDERVLTDPDAEEFLG